MKAIVGAVSDNVVQYLNILTQVDKNAKYVDGHFGGWIEMEINTISELCEIIKSVKKLFQGNSRIANYSIVATTYKDNDDNDVLSIDIYDDYIE